MSDGVAGGGEYEVPDVELSEQALLATARHNTGLEDFGDEADWKEGFTRLLASLNDESRLNRVGRLIAFGELLRHLENRLRVTEDIRRNPSILEVEIRKPVFVVGLPRTGSTILHDLLARDPGKMASLKGAMHQRFAWTPPPGCPADLPLRLLEAGVTVARTADWYAQVEAGATTALGACLADLDAYCSAAGWAHEQENQ